MLETYMRVKSKVESETLLPIIWISVYVNPISKTLIKQPK